MLPEAAADVLGKGLTDPVGMVRFEALRSTNIRRHGEPDVCELDRQAAGDPYVPVALLALDELDACGSSSIAVALLEMTAGEIVDPRARGWQRPAHALVSLAAAAPDRAAAVLPKFSASPAWQARVYAARAAGRMHDAATLGRLAADPDDNVCEAAMDQLRLVEGHEADSLYVAALGRAGYQAIRAAAFGLGGSPSPEHAVPALAAALERLTTEGDDNSFSARTGFARRS